MSSCVPSDRNAAWGSHGSWFLVRPPSRPATWQIRIVREWLRSLPTCGDVAILGSTPEFQDVVSEFPGLRAVVIDRNRAFFDHVRHHRWRRDRSDRMPEVLIGDWTEVLEQNPSRFLAVLSDLTSGNIPYVERARHYSAVSASLVDGGIFVDRVLTLEGRIRSRSEVYEAFEHRPVNIDSINDLNCKLLFTSDIREDEELRIDELLRRASAEWSSDVGRAFLASLSLVTPPVGRWWYGRSWARLEQQHGAELALVQDYPEPPGSAYEGHARLIVKRRGEPPQGLRPVVDAMHATRSRAIAVLDEAKNLLEHLPMPDHELGAAFLDRIVERAVAFRDACLVFRAERMEVDKRHWRFMGALFDRIVDRPAGRDRTYSFCWRYQRTDPLFSPDAAEWKTLFSQAIDMASSGRIVVRALMVTEDRESPRMSALERLSRDVGPAFRVAFIRPQDFEATKDSDGLRQYLDFGVFGASVAFLTTAYEPAVRGDYVWAVERVNGLHDLFDRIWDQAVKPSMSAAGAHAQIDWHVAFSALEQEDRETPVSCVAQVVPLAGGAVRLNGADLQDALGACAESCNLVEADLRACIRSALETRVGAEPGMALLWTFMQRADRPGGPRPPVQRLAPDAGWSIESILQTMYFSQECDFVFANWDELGARGDPREVRKLAARLNSRPHAHTKQIDLADLVAYRDAGMRFRKWIGDWRASLSTNPDSRGSK